MFLSMHDQSFKYTSYYIAYLSQLQPTILCVFLNSSPTFFLFVLFFVLFIYRSDVTICILKWVKNCFLIIFDSLRWTATFYHKCNTTFESNQLPKCGSVKYVRMVIIYSPLLFTLYVKLKLFWGKCVMFVCDKCV